MKNIATAAACLATLAGLAVPASALEISSYPIPWKGIAARNCAVVLDEGNDLTAVVLRCKGKIDVVVGWISRGTK